MLHLNRLKLSCRSSTRCSARRSRKIQIAIRLKSAWLTWIEAKILEALVQSRVDMAKASDDINNVVKTFETARVVATDLNSTLWTNCQRVTKSLPVQ